MFEINIENITTPFGVEILFTLILKANWLMAKLYVGGRGSRKMMIDSNLQMNNNHQ